MDEINSLSKFLSLACEYSVWHVVAGANERRLYSQAIQSGDHFQSCDHLRSNFGIRHWDHSGAHTAFVFLVFILCERKLLDDLSPTARGSLHNRKSVRTNSPETRSDKKGLEASNVKGKISAI